MPDGFLVKVLAIGTKMRSYMGTMRTMERLIKAWSEEAGMSIPHPIDLSMVIPCLVKKVDDCANTIAYTRQVAHMGNSLKTAFASSTSSMVHCLPFPLEPSGASNALFKHLSK